MRLTHKFWLVQNQKCVKRLSLVGWDRPVLIIWVDGLPFGRFDELLRDAYFSATQCEAPASSL